MAENKIELKIHPSITEIPKEKWNALIKAETVPFLDYEWLAALEQSGSIAPETGWYPFHFCLWKNNQLLAAAPFYLKTSSDGEYVYDYFWAEASYSLGKEWYPKLVGTLAATPAEGYCFLCSPEIQTDEAAALILKAAENFCRQNGVASLNLLFADPLWAESLPGFGYTPWEHSHFLWENSGYKDFNDSLSIFSKNQRKNIRKEWQRHEEQRITIKIIRGDDAGEDYFKRMFELFTITNDKFIPWDARWVNKEFFLELYKNYRHGVAFAEARLPLQSGREEGETIAMAFLVRKNKRIWGRFWGAYDDIKDLHFAVCYYAPMDWAIKEGIRHFDPGAGSPHKIRRGFKSVKNTSWHKFFDPVLERLFKSNIANVNHFEEENRNALNAGLPFKKNTPPVD
jgi:predicted N-acyltransferase